MEYHFGTRQRERESAAQFKLKIWGLPSTQPSIAELVAKNIVLVVVAQLVEWLVPIPEVRGSNPIIGKILYWTFTVNCIENTK